MRKVSPPSPGAARPEPLDPGDLPALRQRLRADGGKAWRSFDQVADTDAFRRFLQEEYPSAARLVGSMERRRFFRVMVASLALAGLGGCDDDDDAGSRTEDGRTEEVPFVREPEHQKLGGLMRYNSGALLDGHANGVRVLVRDGRPLKIEGNPDHPWSLGGTDTFAQASVLGLYDPYRSQAVLHQGRPSSWGAFRAALAGPLAAHAADGGQGLHLLTPPVTSPTVLAQIEALRRRFPAMRWHGWSAVSRDALFAGTQAAFGQRLEPRYHLDRARVLVSLDGELLDPGAAQIGQARRWSDARRAGIAAGRLPVLHAVAPTPGLTTARADHPLAAGQEAIARIAAVLLASAGGGTPDLSSLPDPAQASWTRRAAAALGRARGEGLVIAGPAQPPALHVLAHRINGMLGNTGRTVGFTDPAAAPAESLAALADSMDRGQVRTLLMLGVNPAYDAPADLEFDRRLERVGLTIHAGEEVDETAARSHWHLPLAHPLESWGDARAVDGTVTAIQPTIAPLYNGRSMSEILSVLADAEPRGGLAILRDHWLGRWRDEDDRGDAAREGRWREMLLRGFLPDAALPERPVTLRDAAAGGQTGGQTAGDGASAEARAAAAGTVELLFRPDAGVRGGAGSNNAWLQELPRPLTKLVWDNAVLVSPSLAEREGLRTGDVVRLERDGRAVEGPAWIMPGQADASVTLLLGYGRRMPDALADGLGYDATPLRRSDAPWSAAGATLRRTGRRVELATTQDHGSMEGHDLARARPLDAPAAETAATPVPAVPAAEAGAAGDRAWGMVIDLDSCIGCNACVVSCQAENNIAVVGKEEAARGRDMHWLRIDRYYEGEPDAPDTRFQPVPCMHCEDAPCEVGCPVEATLHDHEGLNVMVYNRCVGTRACSGYCPYKVRRFNWLDYSAGASPTMQLQRNPDVTVRSAGVMEKCTYCVQRIAEARIESDRTNTPIPDGAVQTACQTACPTRAITFGNLADGNSAVAARRRDARNYALLGELGVKPRTTYLSAVTPPTGGAEG
ncbi:TAT-variant-translocated molybdopterin oxidoreductase [Rhizosaccharibacter radicis]|uniref:TAT-variant-translocated molybdopterin oxidoreductase n=1 Tax=Rhizosaccharibacter radicis TaxID=2782605 RepID=A0ABT1VU67_9PROT|nr:TAT-variant-translocated molybdopterin oxidoreductase [Acetobacteraceae bacterium KSS12]